MKVTTHVLSLLKQGVSLNKISRSTGISKSTLYYHYKKLNGKKSKPLNLNLTPSQIGEFLGIFVGDGNFFKDCKNYHYTIRIFIGYYEQSYSDVLSELFFQWFGKSPQVYVREYNKKPSVIILQYHSKLLHDLLKTYLSWNVKKTYSICLRSLDLNNTEFNISFLRGLIDTDGSYSKTKNTLSFSTVSKPLIKQVHTLIEFYLSNKIKIYTYHKTDEAPIYTIAVYGSNSRKLLALTQPHNPHKTTS